MAASGRRQPRKRDEGLRRRRTSTLGGRPLEGSRGFLGPPRAGDGWSRGAPPRVHASGPGGSHTRGAATAAGTVTGVWGSGDGTSSLFFGTGRCLGMRRQVLGLVRAPADGQETGDDADRRTPQNERTTIVRRRESPDGVTLPPLARTSNARGRGIVGRRPRAVHVRNPCANANGARRRKRRGSSPRFRGDPGHGVGAWIGQEADHDERAGVGRPRRSVRRFGFSATSSTPSLGP